jgi:hypothetical protein
VFRLWSENSAPPAARSTVLVNAGSQIARDQSSAWESRVFGPRLLMLGIMGGVTTSSVTAENDRRSAG